MEETMDIKLKTLLDESKTIILDFDNTIAATEQFAWPAFNNVLKDFNVELKEEHIKRYIGNTDRVIFSMIEKDFDITIDFDYYFNKRIKFYIESVIASDLKPFKYVYEILNEFKDRDIYILSSNTKKAIVEILINWKLDTYFKEVYSMIDLKSTKEEFIKNSLLPDYFNTKSEDLIVFEDSAKTINMAKSYGAKTVFIKNEMNKNDSCSCDYIIET